MLRIERETAIVDLLAERGVVSVRSLTRAWPSVSAVTIRRDLGRMAAEGRLCRTRGGAVRAPDAPVHATPIRPAPAGLHEADALILPPISGAMPRTLREHARRAGVPFLAESAPQEGGIYLGPDNRAAGRQLGALAAEQQTQRRRRSADLLLLSLEELPNTRERSRGFLEGFQERFRGTVRSHLVDGRGLFDHAFRLALDALHSHPAIDVLFGVNDHSVLAGLEACRRLGLGADRCLAYSVGGEGGALFTELATDGPLRACAALFPEAVGRLAVDAIAHFFAGGRLPDAIVTGFELVTPERLPRLFRREGEHWTPLPALLARLCGERGWRADNEPRDKTIGFVQHYPAHEWYRNLSAAIQRRAAERGMRALICDAEDSTAEQIQALRCRIARAAAETLRDGETILIDCGRFARLFAGEVRAACSAGRLRDLSVVTNSLGVEAILRGTAGLRVMLTGGEVAPSRQALLGPSMAPLLGTIRAQRAVISPDGVSAAFGLSAEDEAVAEAQRRLMQSAREVIVLADHSLVGAEARAHVVPLGAIHTVVTDLVTLPAHRLELAAAGVRVIVADDAPVERRTAPHDAAPARRASQAAGRTRR